MGIAPDPTTRGACGAMHSPQVENSVIRLPLTPVIHPAASLRRDELQPGDYGIGKSAPGRVGDLPPGSNEDVEHGDGDLGTIERGQQRKSGQRPGARPASIGDYDLAKENGFGLVQNRLWPGLRSSGRSLFKHQPSGEHTPTHTTANDSGRWQEREVFLPSTPGLFMVLLVS